MLRSTFYTTKTLLSYLCFWKEKKKMFVFILAFVYLTNLFVFVFVYLENVFWSACHAQFLVPLIISWRNCVFGKTHLHSYSYKYLCIWKIYLYLCIWKMYSGVHVALNFLHHLLSCRPLAFQCFPCHANAHWMHTKHCIALQCTKHAHWMHTRRCSTLKIAHFAHQTLNCNTLQTEICTLCTKIFTMNINKCGHFAVYAERCTLCNRN